MSIIMREVSHNENSKGIAVILVRVWLKPVGAATVLLLLQDRPELLSDQVSGRTPRRPPGRSGNNR